MGTRLNRSGYKKLIEEDIAWLKTMPRSCERDHILAVLENSVEDLYGPDEFDRHQLVWVENDRYTGPGIFQRYVRQDGLPQRGSQWMCEVLLENGNSWWYEVETVAAFPHSKSGGVLVDGECELCGKTAEEKRCQPRAGSAVLKDYPLRKVALASTMDNLRAAVTS